MASNHLCRPLLFPPSIFPSIKVFSNELALGIRWPKHWHLSISPSGEYSELFSFRIDCFDLLAVQGTLKSLLQHHSSKASILRSSAFFMIQLSSINDYWKKLYLWLCKVMSLLFNLLSRFAFTQSFPVDTLRKWFWTIIWQLGLYQHFSPLPIPCESNSHKTQYIRSFA